MSITRNDNLEIRGPKPTRTTDVMGTRLENTYQRKEDIPMNMRFLWCKTTEADGKEYRLEDPNDLTAWTEFKPIGGGGIQEPQNVGDWVRHWNGTIGSWVAATGGGSNVTAATQAEVDAGTVGDKYVSPLTLLGSVMQNNLDAVIHRTQGLDYTPAVPGSADTNLQTDHIGIATPIRMEGNQTVPTGPADRGRELATFGTVGTMINQALTAYQETDPIFTAERRNLAWKNDDNIFIGYNEFQGVVKIHKDRLDPAQFMNGVRVYGATNNESIGLTYSPLQTNLFRLSTSENLYISSNKDLRLGSSGDFHTTKTISQIDSGVDKSIVTKEWVLSKVPTGSGIPEPQTDGSFARKKLGTIYTWEAISAGGGDAYLGRDQIFTKKNTFKSDTDFTIEKLTDSAGAGLKMTSATGVDKLHMYWRDTDDVFNINVPDSPLTIYSQRINMNAVLGTHLSRGYQMRGVEEIKNDSNGDIIINREYLESFGYRPYKEDGIAGEPIEQGMILHKKLDGKYYKSSSTDPEIGAQTMTFAYGNALAADDVITIVTAMSWPCADIAGGCTAHIGKPIYLSATAGEYTLTPPTTGVIKLIGRIAADTYNWFNEDRFLHLESDYTWLSEDKKSINGVEMAFGSGGSGISEPQNDGLFVRSKLGTVYEWKDVDNIGLADVYLNGDQTFTGYNTFLHQLMIGNTSSVNPRLLFYFNGNSGLNGLEYKSSEFSLFHQGSWVLKKDSGQALTAPSNTIALINTGADNVLTTKEWVLGKISSSGGGDMLTTEFATGTVQTTHSVDNALGLGGSAASAYPRLANTNTFTNDNKFFNLTRFGGADYNITIRESSSNGNVEIYSGGTSSLHRLIFENDVIPQFKGAIYGDGNLTIAGNILGGVIHSNSTISDINTGSDKIVPTREWVLSKIQTGSGIPEPGAIGKFVREITTVGQPGTWVAESGGGSGGDVYLANDNVFAGDNKFIKAVTIDTTNTNSLIFTNPNNAGKGMSINLSDTSLSLNSFGVDLLLNASSGKIEASSELRGTVNPTVGTGIGNRDYNDARYAPIGGGGGAYLPLSGGTLTGDLNIEPTGTTQFPLTIKQSPNSQAAHFRSIGDGYIGWVGMKADLTKRFDFESNTSGYFTLQVYNSSGASPKRAFRATNSYLQLFGSGVQKIHINSSEIRFMDVLTVDTDNVHDIGHHSKRFKNIYLGGQALGRVQTGTPSPAIADNEFVTKAWVAANSGGGLQNIVEDTTPELGGDLDAGGFEITNVLKVTESSDRRLKENIEPIATDNTKIEFKEFNFKDHPDEIRYGVIAQDIEFHHPELVSTNENGMKSVNYIDLLILEIANLRKRIELLENGHRG